MNAPDELRTLAIETARAAGRILLGSSPGGRRSKTTPTDLVTEADRAAEAFIFETLRRERPDDSIVSEEGSRHHGGSGIRWIIDPLDGTINFIYGIPQWSVSIGVEGKFRLGVVHDPNRDETFTDASGLTPSSQTKLAESLIATGFSYSALTRGRQARLLARVLPQVRDIRRAGSCALDLCWVAAGRFDGFYEDDTNEWDVSAGVAIIEAAGGHTRRRGRLVVAAGTQELFENLEELVVGS